MTHDRRGSGVVRWTRGLTEEDSSQELAHRGNDHGLQCRSMMVILGGFLSPIILYSAFRGFKFLNVGYPKPPKQAPGWFPTHMRLRTMYPPPLLSKAFSRLAKDRISLQEATESMLVAQARRVGRQQNYSQAIRQLDSGRDRYI